MNQYDAARRPGEIYCVAEWSSMNCSSHYKLQSVKFYFAVTSESPSSVRHGWHVGARPGVRRRPPGLLVVFSGQGLRKRTKELDRRRNP